MSLKFLACLKFLILISLLCKDQLNTQDNLLLHMILLKPVKAL